ncbi:hypothetical protein Taro_047877 [Colocasia esculenta]|uniref:Uncharacterized protein n=1 Tax=Colocasia esculenta TaxID=4460 RepID=A0A843WWL7_COLES|nr:hypothetical protein [Colocasia esculenta]
MLDTFRDSGPSSLKYGAWSTIRRQFWEGPPWEGFVPGISFWFSVCPSFGIVIVAGPSSVSPTVATAVGAASVSPPLAAPPLAANSGQSTHSPNAVVGSVPVDVVSLQEGGGSFYESTLWELWINGFNDFLMEVQELLYQMFMSNHRFTRRSDEARSRLVWTMTARSNFKHLLYNARKNAEKVSQSADPTLWRERAPSWMKRDYWETLCNIWAAERWQQTSTIMKVNRAANPEANMHTGGSVTFATHQSRLESYSQQMIEKYAGEDEQPQLDPEVWVAAFGAPKKGHVYGFGHSMDMSRVLSGASSSASQTSAFNTGVGAPGTSPSDMMGFIANTISGLESPLAQTMDTRLAQTMDTRLVQMQTQVTDAL